MSGKWSSLCWRVEMRNVTKTKNQKLSVIQIWPAFFKGHSCVLITFVPLQCALDVLQHVKIKTLILILILGKCKRRPKLSLHFVPTYHGHGMQHSSGHPAERALSKCLSIIPLTWEKTNVCDLTRSLWAVCAPSENCCLICVHSK